MAKRVVTAVLISANRELAGMVQRGTASRKIHTDIFLDCGAAMRYLSLTKVEAVFIDWSDQRSAATTLNAIRASASNHNAVIFAFTDNAGDSKTAKSLGASFVVELPTTPEKIDVYIRAAYGLMLHELRRYFRFPVSVPIVLRRSDREVCHGITANLSTGGLAVIADALLIVGEQLVIEVTLPGMEDAMKCCAEVCWVHSGGRIGLQFVHAPATLMVEFQQWLASQLEHYCDMTVVVPPAAPL